MDEQSISIGEFLKSARTRRRLTIPEISQDLHIREDYLKALEDDAWERLPGEIYGQGFLKSYARYLDADAEQLVQYRKRLAAKQQSSAAPTHTAPTPTRQRRSGAPVQRTASPHPSRRSRQAAVSGPQGSGRVVLGAAVVLAILFVLGLYMMPKSKPVTTADPGASRTPSGSVKHPHPHSSKSPSASKSHPRVSSSPSSAVTLTSNRVLGGGNTSVVYSVSQSPVAVHLSFTGSCWVEVWKNGVTSNPYGVTYHAGQTLDITAGSSVKVRLGTRLASVVVNGRAVSLPDPGQQVINLTFQHS